MNNNNNSSESILGRLRCVILTDLNGRGITSHSIRRHIAREEQASFNIELVTAYTLEALRRVERGDINVAGAKKTPRFQDCNGRKSSSVDDHCENMSLSFCYNGKCRIGTAKGGE